MADAKPGTLRLQPDLNAALAKAAKGAGTSATKLADQLLRDALGLGSGPAQPGPIKGARQVVGAGVKIGCPHPLLRRIGSACAACGATVKS